MTCTGNPVYFVGALRTPVAPRGGALSNLETHELGALPVHEIVKRFGLKDDQVDHVILGNALYGGGNIARVVSLEAGISESAPALTIDSQCCAGLDAIQSAAALIASGQKNIVIAGGVESFSRSPLRYHRPYDGTTDPIAYDRPPFTPWPDADPDMIEAAAALAIEYKIDRHTQEHIAIRSHTSARMHFSDFQEDEIVPVNELQVDEFTRVLDERLCARLPIISGSQEFGLTSATIAVEADAAAAVLMVSENALQMLPQPYRPIRYLSGVSVGADPCKPGLAPIQSSKAVLSQTKTKIDDLSVVEIMEAFAVQAKVFIDSVKLPINIVNRGGGALARGHPIGASGAILATRLFHELQNEKPGAKGLAAIAAAGGLGSALLLG